MTVAMMLPTALPLLLLFRRFTSAAQTLPHCLPGSWRDTWRSGCCSAWPPIWRTLVFIEQLLVLTACRTTPGYLASHHCSWRVSISSRRSNTLFREVPLALQLHRRALAGQERFNGSTEAGLHHGLFCVGCCWSLMLLMFSVGMGNLAWMLALGVVMAIEKNMPWGRRLSTPLGVILLTAGITLLAMHGGGVACAHDGTSCAHGP